MPTDPLSMHGHTIVHECSSVYVLNKIATEQGSYKGLEGLVYIPPCRLLETVPQLPSPLGRNMPWICC